MCQYNLHIKYILHIFSIFNICSWRGPIFRDVKSPLARCAMRLGPRDRYIGVYEKSLPANIILTDRNRVVHASVRRRHVFFELERTPPRKYLTSYASYVQRCFYQPSIRMQNGKIVKSVNNTVGHYRKSIILLILYWISHLCAFKYDVAIASVTHCKYELFY